VRIHRTDVSAFLEEPPREEGERVILDPPRTGAGSRVVAAIAARKPSAIVYVSCDPPTLARDLHHFVALGYRLDSVTAFDLFPDTFHLETVVRLV
jgi:tRNA/tmRNA/rRNA uracil-C5-methylase (TrmA/RlmC/RlmD family)